MNEQLVAPPRSVWSKGIPRINRVFMIISLVLVFGLDLVIVVVSGFGLMPFWLVMLAVLGVFLIFFFLENYLFRKRFVDAPSTLDPWIKAMIILRNFVFVLNFIPGVQVFGLALLGLLGGFLENMFDLGVFGKGDLGVSTIIMPALFLLYIVLIVFRFRATKSATEQ